MSYKQFAVKVFCSVVGFLGPW